MFFLGKTNMRHEGKFGLRSDALGSLGIPFAWRMEEMAVTLIETFPRRSEYLDKLWSIQK